MKVNPILLEVFKNRFSSIAEEMGVTLYRTGFSPNIKERRDFSCAIFTREGDMIAQAAHIPVHLGSIPLSVKSAIENIGFNEGDMVILNDPFKGGTHLPIKIMENGRMDQKMMRFFLSNVRTPVEREGDLAAQIMANITGIRRVRECMEKYGLRLVDFYARSLMDYTERIIMSFAPSSGKTSPPMPGVQGPLAFSPKRVPLWMHVFLGPLPGGMWRPPRG